MEDRRGYIGPNFLFWSTACGAAIFAGLISGNFPSIAWLAIIGWSGLWLNAIISLADAQERLFLTESLRNMGFVQVQTERTTGNVMWVWRNACKDADTSSTIWSYFGATFTDRLWQKAFSVALLAPIIAVLLQGVIWNSDIIIGNLTVLKANSAWTSLMAGSVIAIISFITPLSSQSGKKPTELSIPFGVFTFIFGALLAATVIFLDSPSDRGGIQIFILFGSYLLIGWMFGFLSIAGPLTLLRRSLRARKPWLFEILNLTIACTLFLLFGMTLIATIRALNALSGATLLDLGALLGDIKAEPWNYIWVYVTVLTPVLPTAIHLLVSLPNVQGLWPRALRRPVATWVEAAPTAPRTAMAAALGLTVIWFVPIAILFAALWLLWTQGGWIVLSFLSHYFDLLLWVAHVPVGAL